MANGNGAVSQFPNTCQWREAACALQCHNRARVWDPKNNTRTGSGRGARYDEGTIFCSPVLTCFKNIPHSQSQFNLSALTIAHLCSVRRASRYDARDAIAHAPLESQPALACFHCQTQATSSPTKPHPSPPAMPNRAPAPPAALRTAVRRPTPTRADRAVAIEPLPPPSPLLPPFAATRLSGPH